jgi:eukaryotic-like serine/threonine-protein kinase
METGSDRGEKPSSRYELLVKIASGGMATVYVGRLRGAVGFRRLVAIKRAHGHLLQNPTFKQMLIDEARLASHIHHPNVVAVQDVEEFGGKLHLVMDYIEGASLSELLTAASGRRVPPEIAVRITLDAASGLHAAHELIDEQGERLQIVHRDVSPHNILVGTDGVARLSDFGIAKFARSGVKTRTGERMGKIGYMAPEYVETGEFDVRCDVFAAGVVAWEIFANRRLFKGSNDVETLKKILGEDAPPLSTVAPGLPAELDAILARALARAPAERFSSARAFGAALEAIASKHGLIAPYAEVGAWVQALRGDVLIERRAQVGARTREGAPSEPGLGVAEPEAPPPALHDGEGTLLPSSAPTVRDKPTFVSTPPLDGAADAFRAEDPSVVPIGGSALSLGDRWWPFAAAIAATIVAALIISFVFGPSSDPPARRPEPARRQARPASPQRESDASAPAPTSTGSNRGRAPQRGAPRPKRPPPAPRPAPG